MKKLIFILFVILWLIVSLFVRVYDLDKSPPSLNFDEASLGYNAYSLMLTGKDEYGNAWPVALRSFNDYKPALYAYAAIPFFFLLGVDQTSVRLPSSVFGTIALLFFFLIFKQISQTSWKKALLISVFVSFLPWRLHFSRVAFEANLSMAFFSVAAWCLLNYFRNKWYQAGTVVFAILSIYGYHSARLAIPVLFALVFLDPLQESIKNIITKPVLTLKKLYPLLIVGLFYIPIFLRNDTASVLQRYHQTNIFNHYFPFSPRELVGLNAPFLSILANPVYYLGGILVGHLLAYLSPKNLSLNIYQWVIHSDMGISGTGMLGWLGGLFFILGFKDWFLNILDRKDNRFLAYWIVAGATPAILTWEWFHPLRSLDLYPALEVIVGFGLLKIIDWSIKNLRLRGKIVLTGLILVCSLFSVYNLLNEFNYSIFDTNGEYQPGGFKEGAELLNSLRTQYSTVYIDSNQAQSYEMLLFYMKYPPENIQKYASIRPLIGTDGSLDFNFDNFVYKKYDWPVDKNKHNFVYWTSSQVLESEMNSTQGAKLYKIYTPVGYWSASIITKN